MRTRMTIPAVATGLLAMAALTPAMLPVPAAAQGNPTYTNVVPQSEAATIHAKITAINPDTRQVTLQGRAGNSVTLTAGPAVRLHLLKVGQVVNAQYYRSVGFMVTPAGGAATAANQNEVSQMIARPAEAPGGIGVQLTKVSGTVVGIDMASHSVDLVDPSGGGIYTIDVTDPARMAMLADLKVGDTITAVVSQVLAVSIEPAPKSLF